MFVTRVQHVPPCSPNPFSLASYLMSRAEYQTPASQTYILIMPSPFAVDILKVLQVRVAEIDVLVKELKRMLRGNTSVSCDMDIKDTDSEGED